MAGFRSSSWKIRSTPSAGLLPDREDPRQLARRRHQLADISRKGEERPEGDVAPEGQPAPEEQDAHLANGRDRLQQRLVARLEPNGPHLGAVERLGPVDHPPHLGVLLPERFHDSHAVHVFVHYLGDIAFALLAVPGGREDAPPHPIGNEQKSWRHDQADDGQQRRQVEHHGQRHHHQQEVPAHDREEAE